MVKILIKRGLKVLCATNANLKYIYDLDIYYKTTIQTIDGGVSCVVANFG